MATSADSVYESSDFVKDFSCFVCESKNIETSADIFCETCLKCFCENCLYHHDQMFVNHSTHGRGDQNKWPLIKTMEDLLLKCDIHNNEKLKMFCQDHSQLCCSDCVLLNHRQCTNLALISESVKKLSVNTCMKKLSNKIQTTLVELNMYKRTQQVSINFVEESCNEKLQEIRELRKNLNADLDRLENSTLKELDEIKTALQTSLKKDIDNCRLLKDELQHLSEAVHGLCDKSKKDLEFIASRKCLDKIHECESYLKENPIKVQSPMIFQANIDLVQYLTKQSCLGRILTINMNPDQVLTVKNKSEFNVKIPSDKRQTCLVSGMCSLPSGHVILVDINNQNLILLDQHYNVSNHCYVSSGRSDICQITSNEVAVSMAFGVQFISVRNEHLVKGRELEMPHKVLGITHHQGALYVTSGTAIYHYTLTGTLIKKLYENTEYEYTVFKCAVSLAGDRIYVIGEPHKLLTLATDGSLISTFTDPGMQRPFCVHITPAGQVIVCASRSHTVIQVNRDGNKKLATIASQKDGLIDPVSVCCNTSIQHILVGLNNSNKIIVMELQ